MTLSWEIVGSFASGLWFPDSDIDVAIFSNSENYINFESTLEKVFKKLKKKRVELGIDNISLIKCNKVSSVRVEMCELYHLRRIDISIFHKKNMSKVYSNYVC